MFLKIRKKIIADYNAKNQKWKEKHGEASKALIKQGLTTLAVLLVIVLFFGSNDLYETYKLSKYGVETYSTVYAVSLNYRPKRPSLKRFLTKCKFHINGKEYDAKYPISRPLKIGDTLKVLYYPENPKINKLIIPDSLKD